MSQFLPLFPLSIVVFPGEELRLHIFEERYKQLINECLDKGATFGVPTVIDQAVSDIATEVEVVRLDRRYPNGTMDITSRGIRRFQIESFYRIAAEKLYPGADGSWLGEATEANSYLQEEVFTLLQQLQEALGMHRKVVSNPEEISAFGIGHDIGLTLKQEYELLSLATETDRMMYIKHHLTAVIPVVRETERLKTRAKLNGHFKNVVPPDF